MILFLRPRLKTWNHCLCNQSNIKQQRKNNNEGLIYKTSAPAWGSLSPYLKPCWKYGLQAFLIRTVHGSCEVRREAETPQWHRRTEVCAKATWCHRAGLDVFHSSLRWQTTRDTPGQGMLQVSFLEISVPAGIVIWRRILIVLRKAIKVTGVSRACNLIGVWTEETGC